jgi:hypothetical protein
VFTIKIKIMKDIILWQTHRSAPTISILDIKNPLSQWERGLGVRVGQEGGFWGSGV